jgi:TnpA family transposase
MAQLVSGVSYKRIKNITDWMLNDETQRAALALVVNAISRLVITQYWGEGRTSSSDGQQWAMKNSCSCMTLILASIIYWQAKEINRVVVECDPEGAGVDLSLIQHISPITWDNVILYGEYMLDRNLIKI